MWEIRCDGLIMGRMKDMKKAAQEMGKMMKSLGKPGMKWSLSEL